MKNIINFFKTLSASDRPYLKIAIIYLAISYLWIVYSDKIIFNIFQDVNSIEYFQLIKGTFFVTGTAILIYFLMRRSDKKVANRNLELTASEKKFRSLLDNLPIGVYYSTITGEFLYGNKAAEKICGYRAEELIGKNFLKLNLLTHKDILKATKLFSLNAMGKTTGPDEFTINRKDGRKIHTEINTHLTQIDDQNVVLGVVKDLTEKVKMDTIVAEWQKLMEYIIKFDPNAIAVLDKDLNFKFVSDRFKEDYRIKNVDIIGKHHYEVFPELPERLRAVHQRTLRGEVIREEDDIFIHPDGTESWTKWECRPWYESEGSIGGIILYTEVITKFKELENKLRNRLEYEKLLSRISSMAVSVDDTNIFLDNCLAEIGKTLDVSRVYIFQHDYKLNSVSNTHEWSAKDIKPQKEFLQNIPSESIPWWTETLMQGKYISYADIELIPDNYAREVLREQNIISIQVVPLFIEGKYFGFLGVDECRIKIKWPNENLELLLTISRIIASTIERVEGEIALEESEEKFRSLADSAKVMISIIGDSTGSNFLYVNHEWENITGYSNEEALQIRPIDIVHPDMRNQVLDYAAKRTKGIEVPNKYELKIRTKSGETKILDFSSTVINYGNKKVLLTSGIDITERKLYEELLFQNNKRLEGFLKISQAITTTFDLTVILQMIVENATKIMNLDSGAVYLLNGEHIRLSATTPPLQIDFPEEFRIASVSEHPHIKKAITTGRHVIMNDSSTTELTRAEQEVVKLMNLRSNLYLPIRLRTKTIGVLILSSIGKVHIVEEKDIILLQGFADQAAHIIDNISNYQEAKQYAAELEAQIKERKKIEEELVIEANRRSVLMEQSKDGIVILDQNGKVFESNKKFAEMLDYPLESMQQLSVFDWEFLHPKEQVIEMIRSVDENGDHFETKHRRKDGSVFDVEISSNASWFAGKKLIFCICRDITERKQAEEKIKNNLAEISRFNKVMVGRELKMIELKKEVNDILKKNGLPEKYKVNEQSK